MFDVLQHSESEGELHQLRPGLIPEEDQEELRNRNDSVEQLIFSEEEEEEGGLLSPQRSHQTEDSELDDLLEDEQVDDFASSVLAALSCWPLGAQVAMVTVRLFAAGLGFFLMLHQTWPSPDPLHLHNIHNIQPSHWLSDNSLLSVLHELHV